MASKKYGLAVALLAAAGALVSAYLVWYKLVGGSLWCVGGTGCDVVNSSAYAELGGVPVALLGLGAYLALMYLGVLWWRAGGSVPGWVPLAAAGISTTGWMFGAYLTWVEARILHAYCIWCLTSFALLTALVVVTIPGALRLSGGR